MVEPKLTSIFVNPSTKEILATIASAPIRVPKKIVVKSNSNNWPPLFEKNSCKTSQMLPPTKKNIPRDCPNCEAFL